MTRGRPTDPRGVAWRLFLTLQVVYCTHFATDFVREHFLVLSLVDDGTVQLDPYYGIHPDIFLAADGHAYHNANPGVSYLAAVPYAVLRPAVDAVVNRVLAGRAGEDEVAYDDPRESRREFFRMARENGWDIRFGLVGLITVVFFMAPLTAWSATVLYRTLLRAGLPPGQTLAASLLYGLGTPVFFRTGYLNQNLAVAVFTLVAFCLLWDPGDRSPHPPRARLLLAGLLGGLGVFCDYSGVIPLGLLGLYALWRRWDDGGPADLVRSGAWYTAGAVPPILALWAYQWTAFGHFLYPAQHHMPAETRWSDLGYQGFSAPSWELASLNLFDPRFGLFITAPLLLLGFAALVWRRSDPLLPRRERWFALGFFVCLTVFFASVQYTRLQYNTGVRYMLPAVPFLFLLTLVVLRGLPRGLAWLLGLGSIGFGWVQAMARVQEQEPSIVAASVRVLFGGLQLPALETLERMGGAYLPGGSAGIAALPALLIMAVLVGFIWTVRRPWVPLADDDPGAS